VEQGCVCSVSGAAVLDNLLPHVVQELYLKICVNAFNLQNTFAVVASDLSDVICTIIRYHYHIVVLTACQFMKKNPPMRFHHSEYDLLLLS